MIYIVGFLIGFGLLTALVNRRLMLWLFSLLLLATAVAALVDFWLWGYDYGHNLDPTAAINIPVGMPLIDSEIIRFLYDYG